MQVTSKVHTSFLKLVVHHLRDAMNDPFNEDLGPTVCLNEIGKASGMSAVNATSVSATLTVELVGVNRAGYAPSLLSS